MTDATQPKEAGITSSPVVESNDEKIAPTTNAQNNEQPVKPEPAVKDESPNEDDNDEEDEEENFLQNIEKEEAKMKEEESAHPHPQPSDAAAAPRLLQDALKSGDVKADESEEEEKKDEGASSTGDATMKESGKGEAAEEQEHVHQRVSFCDFRF
jgi:hypothetical protein